MQIRGWVGHSETQQSTGLVRANARFRCPLPILRKAGDWSEWVRFFLQAVIEQARENAAKMRDILALYDEMKARIVEN